MRAEEWVYWCVQPSSCPLSYPAEAQVFIACKCVCAGVWRLGVGLCVASLCSPSPLTRALSALPFG